MVELRLTAEACEYDFRCQSGVTGGERRGVLQKKVGCVATGTDLAKDFEGDLPRGGHLTSILVLWWGSLAKRVRSVHRLFGGSAPCRSRLGLLAAPAFPALRNWASEFGWFCFAQRRPPAPPPGPRAGGPSLGKH